MEPRQNMDLQIYVLNRISLLETALSNQLPVDLNQAKQIALQSIQQLYEQATAVIQNAAAGLSKAMQYGIDRYPAIVFNSRAVVYGVNDLESALDLYRQWLSESKR